MTSSSVAKPTLAAVATRAGVSLATASKVANGRPDVADGTRIRVERAILELGYETNRRTPSAARPSIAFLADVITSTYAMEVLGGAVRAAEELGIDLVVERAHRQTDPEGLLSSAALTQRLLAANRIGAVLLTAGVGGDVYSTVLGARLPMVVIDPLDSDRPDVVSVGATNWLGGRSAAEHLLSLGHSRIAAICGPVRSMSATARLDGFLSTCSNAGATVPDRWLRRCAFDAQEAAEIAARWFSDDEPPSAIMTGSDLQAMGVLSAAHAAGLRIPDELSIIGYDDTPLATWATPALTAVRQPLADIGRRAVETAHLIHRGQVPESRHIELATRLIVRQSTGRAP
ncbi:substrate-binding domain-containing protein [Tessaracoccus sp. MC1865]|uniref:LacI family DNA-binding transcriptional regulator n=1 Tax=Tessaracoccus sp. MC1865 TaxID=2760310 RepID=UPI001600F50D|nr:substrate-binding domain-containing protein [Tessaracoccus sp. MC1865]MBB1483012.1 substrate-binding domain-containing protein [Tessaracoccus sp. MC1865]QTO37553.1 substrate-binding domain-containing protein [Tessaracoccus sp. MC1865]